MDAPHFCRIRCLRRSEKFIISFIAAAITGIRSGWGIGGGTLLIVFMTVIQGISQNEARGINLIYFLPTSSGALYSHIKNKLIDKRAFIFTSLTGTAAAIISAFLSKDFDPVILKKVFGFFLIFVGIREFFKKDKN